MRKAKIFCGDSIKNSPFLFLRRLEERGCKSLGLGAAAKLIGRPPVRAASVERVQDDISARWIVEALHELARWIVDNRRVAATANLSENLEHQSRFAGSCVSDDLHMLGFGSCRDAQHWLGLVRFEANTVTFYNLVELPRREQFRPLQTASILEFLLPLDVFDSRDWQEDEKQCRSPKYRGLEESEESGVPIDHTFEIHTEACIDIAPFGTSEQE
jgi:hypothetical protein